MNVSIVVDMNLSPDWVPVLGSLNIQAIDNAKVYGAWTRDRTFLQSWPAPASSR